MRLYGFPPNLLFGLVSRPSIIPVVNGQQDTYYNTPYTYDALAPNLGCPAFPYPCNQNNIQNGFPDWLSTLNSKLDVRGLYSNCVNGSYTPQMVFPPPDQVHYTFSHITGYPVAYTTESIFFAQSAYFVTVVMVQWSNVFACKSRKVIMYFKLGFFDLFWI